MVEPVTLRELQHSLMDYLQCGDRSAEHLVAEQPPISAQARLSIYESAYRIRLHQALETDHEMLAWYLGDDQFARLTEAYIRANPSTYTSLREYGNALPAYLRRESPYDGMPVLSELAAFERLMLDVFDAPDADRSGLTELQARPADSWPEMRIRFHPSVQLRQTRTNAVLIWQALKESQTPPEPDVSLQSNWLLWRGIDRLSQFRSLTDVEYSLLDAALAGDDFATLCERLLPFVPESDISGTVLDYLLNWLEQGLVRHLD